MKSTLKAIGTGISLLLSFPSALTCGFGRLEVAYIVWAQGFALLPGLAGDFMRIAFYHMTLEECPLENRIQFGSFFAHPQVRLGRGIYIGSYCVLGLTHIGDRTQIASGVQILSGHKQHARTKEGRIQGSESVHFEVVPIGADCWIGAGAIVMAEVGEGCTIGAASLVNRAIPPWSVAVGNPAHVIRSSRES